ncbi:MAG: phosphoserine phosphatase SerB [Thalassobium sp.]|uniref:phosphoserine phosphatase SerB n=1 Tax=Octadecabacter sp. SW4 TaxID=2602067 RepID=UPI000C103158|nr:phosphoserine phosphatase SerB [Octadecabacter sp. SW4]PHQ80040.1 MAG: phosphoserine phosphatase SerB [Thalassobium sp.]QEE34255.1 phosphoserine phosphatase SerB [Octadecabacter sp. SW4]
MHVATLIAKAGGLDPALVHSLRNAWGGGDAQWLSPDEAAAFHIQAQPANADDVWRSLQGEGVDLVIQPIANRRKKMLIADMDSTMIQQECIDELADEAGVGARVANITARAMNGELDFEGAIDERVGLLAGLGADIIDHVLNTRITYMPGGRALVQTMKAQGAFAALVSGGFTAFTAKVAADLGFDENRANTLGIQEGRLTGKVVRPILGQEAKLDALNDMTARLGIDPADALAVGDGMNDLLMLSRAGTGVALHGKPALQDKCAVKINHGDLTALLFIQGYARDEFIT